MDNRRAPRRHIVDFIEELKKLPQDATLKFVSLRDNQEWKDQNDLDIDVSEDEKEIILHMYS